MGGRGATSGGGGAGGAGSDGVIRDNRMDVPFDEWGKMIEDTEYIPDPTGEYDSIGEIYDEIRYNEVKYDEPITKKQILEEVKAWKNDDGTYGGGDETIYIAYKDGTVLDLTDSETGKFPKTGIVGVSVSTANDQYVWGGEISKKTGNLVPWETWVSPYDESNGVKGKANTHSGYKAVSKYIVRVKHLWVPDTKSGERKYETLRKSQPKAVNEWGF